MPHPKGFEHTSLLIIGGGPAGYTAAIYASRAGMEPILYEGAEPGGQLAGTTDVENYPGYPGGVLGPEMMKDFRQQAGRFGAQLRTGVITHAELRKAPFQITTDSGHILTADTLIIATGAQAKWLGIPSEEKFKGYGVSSCAVCDGFFYRGQAVAVVGGGDSAAEAALYLAKIASQVHLLVRKDQMRASHIMQEKVLAHPKIKVLWSTEVAEVYGDKVMQGIHTLSSATGEKGDLPLAGLFVAIGHQPNTALFSQLDLDAAGYIRTTPGRSHTSIPGVFAAGDVQDPIYRQAVTAAGSGCMAALDAERFLQER